MRSNSIFILAISILVSTLLAQETGTVTDIDGNTYQTVKIGTQWWMAENLKVTRYRNGEPLQNRTDNYQWSHLYPDFCGCYCAYNNDENNAATYGYLYNWYAVRDSRQIAPAGWHVPSDDEWKILEIYLGMSQNEADGTGPRGTDEGGKLKETGTKHWKNPNYGATNESGFTALPGGCRDCSGHFHVLIGESALFWTSSLEGDLTAYYRDLSWGTSTIYRYIWCIEAGHSIRCVADEGSVSVPPPLNDQIPSETVLDIAYPNPFNPTTKIKYSLAEDTDVSIQVFDVLGRAIVTLYDGYQAAGSYSIYWHGKDSNDQPVSSGTYIIVLKAEGVVKCQKVTLMR